MKTSVSDVEILNYQHLGAGKVFWSKLHNCHSFLILQRTWHWPERQGSRQVGFSQVPQVHSLIPACVQRALAVPIAGQAASQRFVVPIAHQAALASAKSLQ